MQLEREGFQPPGSHVYLEYRTTQLGCLVRALALLHGRGSDEQLGADELRAGDVVRRQVDLAHELALGRDLEHPRLAVHGMPQVAVRVDAKPIWFSRSLVAVEDALVGQAAVLG